MFQTYTNTIINTNTLTNTHSYTRVIIPNMSNDLFELILICWDKNQTSPIHNHPENGCILKVLQGELTEDVYVRENIDTLHSEVLDKTYLHTKTRINPTNSISYMCGDDVIHKISNTNLNEDEMCQTVSLHIYSPPKFKYTFVENNKIHYL